MGPKATSVIEASFRVGETSQEDNCESENPLDSSKLTELSLRGEGRSSRQSENQSELERCLALLSRSCLTTASKVVRFTRGLSAKLSKLDASNQNYRLKLRQNRQEFENSEESLLVYL
jgi:hypothetical protein